MEMSWRPPLPSPTRKLQAKATRRKGKKRKGREGEGKNVRWLTFSLLFSTPEEKKQEKLPTRNCRRRAATPILEIETMNYNYFSLSSLLLLLLFHLIPLAPSRQAWKWKWRGDIASHSKLRYHLVLLFHARGSFFLWSSNHHPSISHRSFLLSLTPPPPLPRCLYPIFNIKRRIH